MTQIKPLSLALHAELLSVANALADVARPIALNYFRKLGQDVENKLEGGFDPVTLADRGIEQAMREVLAVRRAKDGIYGEEFGQSDAMYRGCLSVAGKLARNETSPCLSFLCRSAPLCLRCTPSLYPKLAPSHFADHHFPAR